MKKYLAYLIPFFFLSSIAIGASLVTGDGMRSPDRTKTWTMPSVTGTLSCVACTETLSNKSISGGQITSAVANATAAVNSTNSTNVATTQVSSNASFYPLMVSASANGNQAASLGTGLTFNPSTNNLSTTTFTGALSGNATTATSATSSTTATNATNGTTASTSTNASYFPLFAASSSNGNQAFNLGTGLTFNPSTNNLSTTTFTGALSGNATTATSATSATSATNATNTAITDDTSTNAIMYPTWVTTNTGNLPQKTTSTKLTYNPSTGSLATTTFVGALTGTASGNLAATANNHGVLISGSGNTVTVVAPDASTTKVLTSGGASADPTWQAVSAAPTSNEDMHNCGLKSSVGSSALTVALTQSDGSTDPSSGAAACVISFRNATLTTGDYAQVSATAATSVVAPSTTTLGTANNGVYYIMVYAINNAGTIELALATAAAFDEGKVWSTTAISGGNTIATLYSTTARTSKAIRLIGRIRITEATAGTWATAASEVALIPFPKLTPPTVQKFTTGTSQTYTTPTGPSIPLYIQLIMVGGGGGGSSGGSAGNNGVDGTDSTFGGSTASKGIKGTFSSSGTAAGGAATLGTGHIGTAVAGGSGGAGGVNVVSGGGDMEGQPGGGSCLGGAGGGGGAGGAGASGATYSGSGGGGGGASATVANTYAGNGGGAGGCINALISNPLATYTYTVGASGGGGSAGTNGAAGGAGAGGYIEVREFYQHKRESCILDFCAARESRQPSTQLPHFARGA